MKIIKLVALAPLVLALTACNQHSISGDGKISTDSRNLGGFTTVAVSGKYQVQIVAGKVPAVQITADENLLSSISTDIQNRVLSIHGPQQVSLKPSQDIVVKVIATNLSGIDTSGNTQVSVERLNGQDLNIDMSGTSTVDVSKVSGDNLIAVLSGDGQLKVVGQIKNLQITSSGNNVIEAKNLISQQAQLDLSGTSQASVAAQQTLMIKASGDTKVTYYGNPKKVTQDISGQANITHIPLLKTLKPEYKAAERSR